MRLDPIYLVAPEPEPPRPRFSRRQMFVAAAGAFGVGWGLGVGLRSHLSSSDPLAPEDEALVQWAERAQSRGMNELLRDRAAFLQVVIRFPVAAPRLRVGIDRLIEAALSDRDLAADTDRRMLARELLEALDNQADATSVRLLRPDLRNRLREIAR